MVRRLTWLFIIQLMCWMLSWSVGQETQHCTKDGICPEDPWKLLKMLKSIDIPEVENDLGFTNYKLVLTFGETRRIVKRRYSEMHKFKDSLQLKQFDDHFPAKRVFENVQERQERLPKWLMAVVEYVRSNMDESTAPQAKLMQEFLFVDTISEWWEAIEKEYGGKCQIKATSADAGTKDVILSEEFASLENVCPDFGKIFGWWGTVACPAHLTDIVQDVKGKCKGGEGGFGGIPPLLCGNFVMKVAKDNEVEPIKNLLHILKGMKLATDKLSTLLLPVCRLIEVVKVNAATGETISEYFTVSPKVALQDKKLYPFAGFFDLKGNWGYDKRMSKGSTLKDGNFKIQFPDGLDIASQYPSNGSSVVQLVIEGSKILADMGHSDYSIVADMVELPPPPQEALAFKTILDTHKRVPLIWGTHRNKTYVAAFGQIDLFYKFDQRSIVDAGGEMVTQMRIDSCTPWDIDPIQPHHYRTRHLRQLGYNVKGPGSHAEDAYDLALYISDRLYKCGACYRRGPKAFWHQEEYTCFKSDYQRQGLERQALLGKDACEWSP